MKRLFIIIGISFFLLTSLASQDLIDRLQEIEKSYWEEGVDSTNNKENLQKYLLQFQYFFGSGEKSHKVVFAGGEIFICLGKSYIKTYTHYNNQTDFMIRNMDSYSFFAIDLSQIMEGKVLVMTPENKRYKIEKYFDNLIEFLFSKENN